LNTCSNCSWEKCFFTLPPGQKAKVTGVVGSAKKKVVTKKVVLVSSTPYFAVCKHNSGYREAFLRVDCKIGEIKIKPVF